MLLTHLPSDAANPYPLTPNPPTHTLSAPNRQPQPSQPQTANPHPLNPNPRTIAAWVVAPDKVRWLESVKAVGVGACMNAGSVCCLGFSVRV